MRWLKRTLLTVLGLAAVAVCACYLSINHIAKTGIERVGPLLTGGEVKVRSVLLSPITGKGRLRGLEVGNPPGFKTDAAFRARTIRVEVDLSSLLTDTWVVRRVVVEAPEVTYEGSLKGSNISKILENVERFSPSGGSKSASRKYLIEHLYVKDGRVRMSASMLGGKAVTVPMGDLHLEDIGDKKGGGASLSETTLQALKPMANAVSKASLEQGKQAVGEVREQAEKGLKALEGLFSK